MVHFKAFEKGMEVSGAAIMAIIDGMGTFTLLSKGYLAQAGLTEEIVPDADHWYSQQQWLDAFQLISNKVGEKTLYIIGTKIPENAVFPPDIDSIEKALASIDVAYHMNHQNSSGEILFDPSRPADQAMLEGIGHYGYEKILGEEKAELVCNNPYPCDFDKGIIAAMARRFNKAATITHDDSAPCRKKGADSCTYTVTW